MWCEHRTDNGEAVTGKNKGTNGKGLAFVDFNQCMCGGKTFI